MPAKLRKLVGNYCKLWSKTTGWKEVLLLSDAQTHQVSVKYGNLQAWNKNLISGGFPP